MDAIQNDFPGNPDEIVVRMSKDEAKAIINHMHHLMLSTTGRSPSFCGLREALEGALTNSKDGQ